MKERPFTPPTDGEFVCIDCGGEMNRMMQLDCSHELACPRCGNKLRLFRGPNDTTQHAWRRPPPAPSALTAT